MAEWQNHAHTQTHTHTDLTTHSWISKSFWRCCPYRSAFTGESPRVAAPQSLSTRTVRHGEIRRASEARLRWLLKLFRLWALPTAGVVGSWKHSNEMIPGGVKEDSDNSFSQAGSDGVHLVAHQWGNTYRTYINTRLSLLWNTWLNMTSWSELSVSRTPQKR